jgi:hypothetical protein
MRQLRGSLANLRSAAEALAPLAHELGDARGALLAVVVEEATRLSEQLAQLERELEPRPPSGRRTAVRELVANLLERAEPVTGMMLRLVSAVPDGALAGSARDLTAGLLGILGRLRRDLGVGEAVLRCRVHDGLLVLDVGWTAGETEQWRLRQQHADVLAAAEPGEVALRDLVQGVGGEVWLSLERGSAEVALRLLLPLAA